MYFQSSLVIRYGMQTRSNCQSSYFTEQWWIFILLCHLTKFYRQVSPPFDYLRNDSLSNSFITFTHGHPLIQNNGPASQEKEVTTLGVISRSLNDSTQRHTREGVRYRLDISWSHFKEQRGELPPGSAELFKNVISLIRVPMAHPNHNCQHAPRNTIRNLHMLSNFFLYQFTL